MGERLRIGTLVLVGLGSTMLAACKPHTARAPRRDVSGMTVDQIERELARNREDLEAAGVWVPEPAPAASAPPESPPADPGTETPPSEAAPELSTEEDEPSPEPAPTDAIDATDVGQGAEMTSRRSRRARVDRESRREAATRCDRICDLAEVTCDLQDQICSLTAKHAHEVRYQAACVRAELQCEASERECELCSE